MIRTLLLIGLGGGLGSILRYLMSAFVNKHISAIFPWGTFAVNILGCLLVGVLLGMIDRQQWTNPDLKFLFVIGFGGGFTTFSAFAAENIDLLQSGHYLHALLYIVVSIVLSLLAVWCGFAIVKC